MGVELVSYINGGTQTDVLENRVLRRIFLVKRDEMMGRTSLFVLFAKYN
jgi:hypothetical protein